MIVMHQVQQLQDVKGFMQHIRKMAVDTILVLAADQSVQAGVPGSLTDIVLANDGVSRLYCDNPLLHMQRELQQQEQTWTLGWATQRINTHHHQGIGLLTTHVSGKLWRRVISVDIQIQVMDMGRYVIGVIVTKDYRLVRRAMLQKVHDLLKAQVKPILLFGPGVFSDDLVQWGWLDRQMFAQQPLNRLWEHEIWCDCADEVTVIQTCTLPERHTGLVIDFK